VSARQPSAAADCAEDGGVFHAETTCDDVTCAATCTGDLDGNGNVNLTGLLDLLALWGDCAAPCPADLNGDERVAVGDLLLLLAHWNPCS
jgi:hypothetical protein